MARGNGRQGIVRDDHDRQRLLAGWTGAGRARCCWRAYAFVILSNYFHIVLKTPQPNLARGMQTFLSSSANAWSRRHRFSGHVFQSRYRTELVKDETYLALERSRRGCVCIVWVDPAELSRHGSGHEAQAALAWPICAAAHGGDARRVG